MMRFVALSVLAAVSGAARAQELPPPGGWPLRPVAELHAVPEPPGGLWPYRRDTLWGYADTTGRVWIRPQFSEEPPRLVRGVQFFTVRQRQPAKPAWGHRYNAEGYRKDLQNATTVLFNARGEQLTVPYEQALVAGPGGRYRAAPRVGALGQPELVAIEAQEFEPPDSARLRTVPVGPGVPEAPRRLLRRRHFEIEERFIEEGPYRYLAHQVNWLLPGRTVHLKAGHERARSERETRYRHRGLMALFDQQGRRLTPYRYTDLQPLTRQLLVYQLPAGLVHHAAENHSDDWVVSNAVLPTSLELGDSYNRYRYGLLTRDGREVTPPDFLRLKRAGPNALWAVANPDGRLHYGLIDTLGHYRLPLQPEPLSSADAAGLVRRRSALPLPERAQDPNDQIGPPLYPDTATVSYWHTDGRPAFAGRFERAGAFWQNRALVRQRGRYGLIDTLGHWVEPPQPAPLSLYRYSDAQADAAQAADPLHLFDLFMANPPTERGHDYADTRPAANRAGRADSLLLLVRSPQGYGLVSYGLVGGRSGRLLVAPCFDEPPQSWYGAFYGLKKGQPWLVPLYGLGFNPQVPRPPLPLGVAPPSGRLIPYRPAVYRAPRGYQTRGGRRLWAD